MLVIPSEARNLMRCRTRNNACETDRFENRLQKKGIPRHSRNWTILAAATFLAFGAPARADDFHVTTAQELQSALTQAAENGVADTITLAAGSYIGNSNYNSTEAFDLTVRAEEARNRPMERCGSGSCL
jgi:hypothetical protein